MARVASYTSPKTEKGRHGGIEGRGLFAVEPITRGEVVGIKGGEILTRAERDARLDIVGNSEIRIAEDFYLAATDPEDYEAVMLFLNHSCEPNVGVQGNVVFVAMRDMAPGEELTIDYAMIDGDPDERMDCRCGAPSCRGVITGDDWRLPELQRRYSDYFSWYLLKRMQGRT
jgi:hypothetical protein